MIYRYFYFLLVFAALIGLTSCGGGGGGSSASPPNSLVITPSGSTNVGGTVVLAGSATDPAGLALSYTWNFGDGLSNDTGATVYRVYSTAGTYTVTLTATNSAGASTLKTASLTISSASATNIPADCTGTNCSASTSGSNNTYSGTGTGVWRFDNQTSTAVTRDINIQNVAPGKTVTLLFTNGQTSSNASTVPSLGVLAAPALAPSPVNAENTTTQPTSDRARGEIHHTHILHANRNIGVDLRERAGKTGTQQVGVLSSAPVSAVVSESGTSQQPPLAVALGDTRTWNENAFDSLNYATTAKVVCAAGTLGRKVIFWVQTSIYVPVSSSTSAVTDAKLANFQSQFCGTNNNDGQYAKIANLLGDAWGTVPSKYVSRSIADTSGQKQDINIVIIAPPTSSSWGGYFYSLNNVLKTTSSSYANSNEALVFFINSRQSANYISSVLIHELTHMINFYQRGILHDDYHETWLEETSAMMTQDIFDLGLNITAGCLPIVCEVRDFAVSGANVSYFNWPTSSISNVHYNLGGSFGAFLNHKYGPVIATQLMTDCYTPTTNTTSFACLDFLIKQNGGVSFADEFAKMGASVLGRVGGTSEPTGYGFPAKSGTLAAGVGNVATAYTYSLPAFNAWWTSPSTITIPTATSSSTFPYTSQTYTIDTVATGKTSYVRTGVSIPAKTSLITVIK